MIQAKTTKEVLHLPYISHCYMKIFILLLLLNLMSTGVFTQTGSTSGTLTIAISERLSSFDTLTSTSADAAAERIRVLIFNSLVKKDKKLDYVGDLARQIRTSEDGKTITFVLREDVSFHDGKILTSADVKYTFDELFKSGSYKKNIFFETAGSNKIPFFSAIETPNLTTVTFVLNRASLKNLFFSYLAAIPIISKGTVDQQRTQPVGSGPFKFVSFDQKENVIQLQAHTDYFDVAPIIQKIRIKGVIDPVILQTELQSGAVDMAYPVENLSPELLNLLAENQKLTVSQFNGSNIVYLGFNTQSPVLKNIKIRRAIAYGIDRQKIINELLYGQAKVAHSMLPPESWAYSEATNYDYNLERAKQLVRKSGYKKERILFKLSAGNTTVFKYGQVIQSMLREIGLNVEIEALEPSTLRLHIMLGQFQMNTGRWVTGNQDPLFLKDLFWSGAIPDGKLSCCNRSRYTNRSFDQIIEQAVETTDREKAKILYAEAQKIVSNDLPVLPLWYPANMVVYNKRLGDVEIPASGDWSFVKDLMVSD